MLGLVPSNPRNRRVVSGILAALPPASLPMRRALYLARSTPLLRCPRRLTPRPAALHCSLRLCSGDTCEDDDDGRPRIYASYDSWADELFPAPGGDSSPADPVWRKEKVEADGGGRPTPAAAQWSGLKRKAPKNKSSWVCANCGESFSQWWGSCRSCGETSTLKQFSLSGKGDDEGRGPRVAERIAGAWLPRGQGSMRPQRLSEVIGGMNQSEWRISLSGLFGAEVSRVLGGGLVPGSLVLVGGDPGVGKSTLLLQIAAILAEGTSCGEPAPVVYISGEESIEQIGHRANRMRIGTDSLFLYSSTDIEDILDKVQSLSPRAVIVDSIQTVYLKSATGSAGGLSQVRECTSQFLCYAKQTKIPIFLIGHVTKSGDIAGPRVLEHIVDTVLYMEGERYSSHRLLRSVKNRFGSTDELGVFEMSEIGLQAVTNPSEIFLSEDYIHSEVLAGLAVAVIVDSSRTFLIEIQALCASSPTVSRHYNGVSGNRADMIVSVLIKQAGLKLQDNAIFLNIVSGFKLEETAGDLAIAAAICSSFLEVPIPKDIAFIGEIGLGGELRMVPRMDKRVNAISKLGYRKCVIPKTAEKLLKTLDLGDLIVIGCSNLKDVINQIFA